MTYQGDIFLCIIELQGLIHNYIAHKHVLKHKKSKSDIKDFFVEKNKMDILLINIKLKKDLLKIEGSMDDLLKYKLPFMESLKEYPPYKEFLRTNYLPIQEVTFTIDKKRRFAKAFRKANYTTIDRPYYI